MLKEALAANTIGGKVDDESRRRAAQEDVRQAQASWSRVGPVPTMRGARSPIAFSARSGESSTQARRACGRPFKRPAEQTARARLRPLTGFS